MRADEIDPLGVMLLCAGGRAEDELPRVFQSLKNLRGQMCKDEHHARCTPVKICNVDA